MIIRIVVYVYIYIYVNICIYTYIYIYIYMLTYIHTQYAHTRAIPWLGSKAIRSSVVHIISIYLYIHQSIYLSIYIYIYMYIYIYIYVYRYTHTYTWSITRIVVLSSLNGKGAKQLGGPLLWLTAGVKGQMSRGQKHHCVAWQVFGAMQAWVSLWIGRIPLWQWKDPRRICVIIYI